MADFNSGSREPVARVGALLSARSYPSGSRFPVASSVVTTYTMRGRLIADGTAVVWYPTGAPDLTGAFSGYPVGDIDQIVCLGSVTA